MRPQKQYKEYDPRESSEMHRAGSIMALSKMSERRGRIDVYELEGQSEGYITSNNGQDQVGGVDWDDVPIV